MSPNQAKAAGYTHHAEYFGIPCWYADDGLGCRLDAKSRVGEWLMVPAMYIEGLLGAVFFGAERSAVFQIKVLDEI